MVAQNHRADRPRRRGLSSTCSTTSVDSLDRPCKVSAAKRDTTAAYLPKAHRYGQLSKGGTYPYAEERTEKEEKHSIHSIQYATSRRILSQEEREMATPVLGKSRQERRHYGTSIDTALALGQPKKSFGANRQIKDFDVLFHDERSEPSNGRPRKPQFRDLKSPFSKLEDSLHSLTGQTFHVHHGDSVSNLQEPIYLGSKVPIIVENGEEKKQENYNKANNYNNKQQHRQSPVGVHVSMANEARNRLLDICEKARKNISQLDGSTRKKVNGIAGATGVGTADNGQRNYEPLSGNNSGGRGDHVDAWFQQFAAKSSDTEHSIHSHGQTLSFSIKDAPQQQKRDKASTKDTNSAQRKEIQTQTDHDPTTHEESSQPYRDPSSVFRTLGELRKTPSTTKPMRITAYTQTDGKIQTEHKDNDIFSRSSSRQTKQAVETRRDRNWADKKAGSQLVQKAWDQSLNNGNRGSYTQKRQEMELPSNLNCKGSQAASSGTITPRGKKQMHHKTSKHHHGGTHHKAHRDKSINLLEEIRGEVDERLGQLMKKLDTRAHGQFNQKKPRALPRKITDGADQQKVSTFVQDVKRSNNLKESLKHLRKAASQDRKRKTPRANALVEETVIFTSVATSEKQQESHGVNLSHDPYEHRQDTANPWPARREAKNLDGDPVRMNLAEVSSMPRSKTATLLSVIDEAKDSITEEEVIFVAESSPWDDNLSLGIDHTDISWKSFQHVDQEVEGIDVLARQTLEEENSLTKSGRRITRSHSSHWDKELLIDSVKNEKKEAEKRLREKAISIRNHLSMKRKQKSSTPQHLNNRHESVVNSNLDAQEYDNRLGTEICLNHDILIMTDSSLTESVAASYQPGMFSAGAAVGYDDGQVHKTAARQLYHQNNTHHISIRNPDVTRIESIAVSDAISFLTDSIEASNHGVGFRNKNLSDEMSALTDPVAMPRQLNTQGSGSQSRQKGHNKNLPKKTSSFSGSKEASYSILANFLNKEIFIRQGNPEATEQARVDTQAFSDFNEHGNLHTGDTHMSFFFETGQTARASDEHVKLKRKGTHSQDAIVVEDTPMSHNSPPQQVPYSNLDATNKNYHMDEYCGSKASRPTGETQARTTIASARETARRKQRRPPKALQQHSRISIADVAESILASESQSVRDFIAKHVPKSELLKAVKANGVEISSDTRRKRPGRGVVSKPGYRRRAGGAQETNGQYLSSTESSNSTLRRNSFGNKTKEFPCKTCETLDASAEQHFNGRRPEKAHNLKNQSTAPLVFASKNGLQDNGHVVNQRKDLKIFSPDEPDTQDIQAFQRNVPTSRNLNSDPPILDPPLKDPTNEPSDDGQFPLSRVIFEDCSLMRMSTISDSMAPLERSADIRKQDPPAAAGVIRLKGAASPENNERRLKNDARGNYVAHKDATISKKKDKQNVRKDNPTKKSRSKKETIFDVAERYYQRRQEVEKPKQLRPRYGGCQRAPATHDNRNTDHEQLPQSKHATKCVGSTIGGGKAEQETLSDEGHVRLQYNFLSRQQVKQSNSTIDPELQKIKSWMDCGVPSSGHGPPRKRAHSLEFGKLSSNDQNPNQGHLEQNFMDAWGLRERMDVGRIQLSRFMPEIAVNNILPPQPHGFHHHGMQRLQDGKPCGTVLVRATTMDTDQAIHAHVKTYEIANPIRSFKSKEIVEPSLFGENSIMASNDVEESTANIESTVDDDSLDDSNASENATVWSFRYEY